VISYVPLTVRERIVWEHTRRSSKQSTRRQQSDLSDFGTDAPKDVVAPIIS